LAVCSRGDAGEAAATAVDAWESDDNDNTGALDGAAWGGCVDAGHCAGSKGGTTGRTWTNSEPAPPGGATELMAVLDSLSVDWVLFCGMRRAVLGEAGDTGRTSFGARGATERSASAAATSLDASPPQGSGAGSTWDDGARDKVALLRVRAMAPRELGGTGMTTGGSSKTGAMLGG
jgi:hypothetical protein